MKFLITGVAGMIGSHLTDLLLEKQFQVVGVDNFSVGTNNNIKDHLKNENFKFFEFDLLDDNPLLEDLVKDSDIVIHLAAVKKVSESQNAFNTLNVNVESTKIILNFCNKFKKRLVFASTSDVYGISEDIPFKERGNTLLGPSTAKRWAYAVSKLYCEHLCLSYSKDFNQNVVILRYFGGFSEKSSLTWSGGHIAVFIEKLMKDELIQIHGDGTQTRSMGHGSDLANGTMLAALSDISGEIINIGNDEEMSVIDTLWLIGKLMKIPKTKIKLEFLSEQEVFGDYKDIQRRVPDLSKAKKLLNYEPKVKLTDAIQMVISELEKK